MISFVRGDVGLIHDNAVEIDTGSFGLLVYTSSDVLSRLPAAGTDITMYTYMSVKEDDISLYGFLSRDELSMFTQLITVNGVGPKGALQILSAFTPSELRLLILAGDVKKIQSAPGVGAKTAQRIVMELKDKTNLADALSDDQDGVPSAANSFYTEESEAKNEAVLALTALGYGSAEAIKAVSAFDSAGMDTEAILKEALKRL